MSNTIFITANWTTGALSQQTISRQYDNNRYAVQFIGYPEGDGTEELDLYLLVWMSTAPGQKPREITPIQLNSDQWYISNYFTQQVQVIKFQLCVLNEAGTYETHSPIFSGRIGDSLEHDGTSHDIDVSTLFDAYREYLNELIIGAGAVIIDPVPTQGSTNAVSSGGVYTALRNTDTTLTQSGQAADAKVVGDALADKVAKPLTSPNGTNGQLLQTNGDGTTQWTDYGLPTDAQVTEIFGAWLDDHPEATTTVQDGAITEAKLADALKLKTIKDYVTPEMFGAVGDGVADDSTAIQNALNSGKPVVFSQKTYHIESTIEISNHGSSSATWIMDARNAKFHYTGNDYAFFIHSLINSKLYFGSIISTNGGNIKFISGDTSAHNRSQYVTIEFGIMDAASGFSNVYAENSGTEWINEIKWIGGRFIGHADCNFNIVRNAPDNSINGWSFYRIGFEGSTTCIQLGGTYDIQNFAIYDCRYIESYTNFIVANGPVVNLVVYSPRPVPMEKVHWNSNCDRWRFYTGNYESLSIKNGVAHYINTSRSISGGIEIEANTDIDDVTLVGNYVIGTTAIANTLINLPLASAGKLIVESLTSNGKLNPDNATSRYLLQTFIPLQVGVKFTRRINITNSGASKEVFEWIPNYPYYPNQSFSSGDDLNNYLSVGTWYSGGSTLTQSLLNKPSGISNTFRLDVIAINSTKGTGFVSGMVRQQKIQDGKGHIFIRMLSTANNALSIGNWLQVTTTTVS